MPLCRMDCANSSRRASLKTIRGCISAGWSRSTSSSIKSCPNDELCEKSASSPLPSAFLDIVYHLLCQPNVALCAFRLYVVEYYRFSMTWRFRQSNVSGNDGCKDLRPEKVAKVGHYLCGEICAFIKHR